MDDNRPSNHRHHQDLEDRLSALPDALLHQILSSFDMRDVVRTSILSNRWRFVWLSTPYLIFNIDHRAGKGIRQWRKSVSAFVKFVQKVLDRTSPSPIYKFNIDSYNTHLDKAPINTWLLTALKRQVQHLCLNIPLYEPLNLPDDLFTSNVRVSRLCIYESLSNVCLPSTICSASLVKDMFLDRVILPNGNTNGELTLSCPVLEKLTIRRTSISHLKRLIISTPLLESLDFDFVSTRTCKDASSRWSYGSSLRSNHKKTTSCKVVTITPNLKSFDIVIDATGDSGTQLGEYFLEDLSSLVSTRIYVMSGESTREKCSEFLAQILPRVCNVQSLELSDSSIQALIDIPELLERLADLFHNLRDVMLIDSEYSCLPAAIDFLDRFPCIETLVWIRRSWRSVDGDDEWAENLHFQHIFSFLKTFEVHNFSGSEAELKFLEFLLERAIILKELIIRYKSSFSSEKLTEFNKKLLSLPKASSSASISFQLDI